MSPTALPSISVGKVEASKCRRLVLHLHRDAVYFLHEQHQHLRRNQRSRSGSIDHHRVFPFIYQHRGYHHWRRCGLCPEPCVFGNDGASFHRSLARSVRFQLLSCEGLCGRYVYLFCGGDIRCSGNFWAF